MAELKCLMKKVMVLSSYIDLEKASNGLKLHLRNLVAKFKVGRIK